MAHENAGSRQDPVIDRYSGLARIAAAGGTPIDGDPDAFAAGCFGAAAYPVGTEGAPEAALRASLGCGNPLAVADLQSGEIVLDLGSGGGLDVLLSARRVAPGGLAYGLDASADMLALAEANAAQAAATTPGSCTAASRPSRCLTSTSTSSSPIASSTCRRARSAS